MKVDRQKVFDKYGGKCAYCGCELKKGWHIDHIEPIVRSLSDNSCQYTERENEANYNPSCASCNMMKGSSSIEYFRIIIGQFVESLNKYTTQYKFAKKYGLVQETGNKVIFYFETINNQ